MITSTKFSKKILESDDYSKIKFKIPLSMYDAGVSPAWTLETIIIYFFLSNLGGLLIFLSGKRNGKSILSSNIKLLLEIELIVKSSISLFSTL